jgi:hypothetical protein
LDLLFVLAPKIPKVLAAIPEKEVVLILDLLSLMEYIKDLELGCDRKVPRLHFLPKYYNSKST